MLNFHCSHFQTGVRVRLTFRKMKSESIIVSYFFIYILRSSQRKKTAGKDAKAGKLVALRTRGRDGKIGNAGARAISQSDSGI